MAEFLPPVVLEIQAKASQAIAQMQTVNGELDKMQTKALKAGGSLEVMSKASKYSGTILLGIAGVLGTVGAASVKMALNVQVSQAKLQTAVKNTGVSFQNFAPYMDKSTSAMAKFGFHTGDTMNALAILTTATRNPQTAINNLGIVADLAAYKQESLAQAAVTVAGATTGQARGLRDLGLAIGKTIPKGADLATISKLIEDRIHGAAAAAAKADPWKALSAQFEDLGVKLGTTLLPAFRNLVSWLGDLLPAFDKIGHWISSNKGLFEFLGGTLAALWVAPKIDGLLFSIGKIAGAWDLVAVSAGKAATAEGVAEAEGVAGSTIGTVNKFSNVVPIAAATGAVGATLGKGAPMIGSALGLKKHTAIIRAGGTAAGAGGGALTGALAGSAVFPVVGTAVGAVVGTIAGGLLGWLESKPGQAVVKKTAAAKPLGSINSGLSPQVIPTKATTKKQTAAQAKAGIMTGGNLTIIVGATQGSFVQSIKGSAGSTKVIKK
jgi:hypothetical protein